MKLIFAVVLLGLALTACTVSDYSIQDVEVWCWKNCHTTMSPTGENCSQVMQYVGEPMRTEWRVCQ